MPSFAGNLLISSPSGTKLSHKKLETLGYHTESLSHLALNPYRVVTDGRTDRIAIANTRSQQYLPVQLSRVKTKIYTAFRTPLAHRRTVGQDPY